MLSSSKCMLPQLLPKMQRYPSPQILAHLHVGKDSSTIKMLYPNKPFPTNSVLYLCFLCYFIYLYIYLFIYLFIYFLLLIFLFPLNCLFLFSSKTWNSSPKWKNYSPEFEANNRRIDTPAHASKDKTCGLTWYQVPMGTSGKIMLI